MRKKLASTAVDFASDIGSVGYELVQLYDDTDQDMLYIAANGGLTLRPTVDFCSPVVVELFWTGCSWAKTYYKAQCRIAQGVGRVFGKMCGQDFGDATHCLGLAFVEVYRYDKMFKYVQKMIRRDAKNIPCSLEVHHVLEHAGGAQESLLPDLQHHAEAQDDDSVQNEELRLFVAHSLPYHSEAQPEPGSHSNQQEEFELQELHRFHANPSGNPSHFNEQPQSQTQDVDFHAHTQHEELRLFVAHSLPYHSEAQPEPGCHSNQQEEFELQELHRFHANPSGSPSHFNEQPQSQTQDVDFHAHTQPMTESARDESEAGNQGSPDETLAAIFGALSSLLTVDAGGNYALQRVQQHGRHEHED